MATDIFSKEFDDMIVAAGIAAREETLAAGVPVFYIDHAGVDVMEMPDGRKFQIRFIPHAMDETNYEIVRELRSAA